MSAALAALMSLAYAAAPAGAGVASMQTRTETDGSVIATLTYLAASGERNLVLANRFEGDLLFSDKAPVRAGAGCTRDRRYDFGGRAVAHCPLPAGVSLVEIREFLRAGHDVSSAGHPLQPSDVAIHGGPGDDSIDDANVLYGGGGDDFLDASNEYGRLFGGPGNDTANGGGGPDTINLGAGRDITFTLGDDEGRAPDVVQARDSTTDEINCLGRDPQDSLVADQIDFVDGCAAPQRNGPSFAVPLDIRSDSDDDRGAVLTLGCSDDGPRICRGNFTVSSARGPLGADSFRFSRARNYYILEINSRIPARRLARLGRVRVRIRTFDSTGRRRFRSLPLPVTH